MGGGCSVHLCTGERSTTADDTAGQTPLSRPKRNPSQFYEAPSDLEAAAPFTSHIGLPQDTSEEKHTNFGPMVIKTHVKTALLVWAKQDKSLLDIQRLLSQVGFSYELANNEKHAQEFFAKILPFLVVVDGRKLKKSLYDVTAVIRFFRETYLDYEPVIFVLFDRLPKEDHRRHLIELGATKILSYDLSTLSTELCWFETVALPILIKVRSTPGLFAALENCDYPIEITDALSFVQGLHTLKMKQTNVDSKPLISVQSDNDADLDSTASSSGWRTFPVFYSQNSSSHCQIVHMKRSSEGQQLKPSNTFNRRPPSFRNRTLVVDTPLAETLSLLKEASNKAKSEEIQKLLQQAIRSLNFAEVYTPLITKFKKDDRVASNLYGGLVLNGPLNLTSPMQRARKASLCDVRKSDTKTPKISSELMKTVSPSIRSILELEESWDFDVFELERLTNAKPMVHLAMKIFERWRVCEFLQCTENRLKAWLEMIENNYHADNPYHASTHATDVLHASAFYLTSEIIANAIDHSDAVAALIAAVIHDVDHPGKGSPFLINTRHPLALLYNDISVLENHHAALAFQLTISDSHVNIFENLPPADFKPLRKSIVEMVLATDMTRHFEYLAKFQSAILSGCADGQIADKNLQMPVENRRIIRQILIKAADISNPTRPWHLCKQWGFRIVDEYFAQTAEERAKGLPLTMEVFDRETCNIPQTQCSFIDMFVRELFKGWCSFGRMPQLLYHIEKNYAQWRTEIADWSTTQNSTATLSAASNRRQLGVNVSYLNADGSQSLAPSDSSTSFKSRLLIGRASVDVHLPDSATLVTATAHNSNTQVTPTVTLLSHATTTPPSDDSVTERRRAATVSFNV